ncbi:hypothetical protein BLOT_014096 [Blomia tropicalis]|nr:hypothetical protein BLOT_014096 [Blomia tropicalis]
MHSPMIGVNRLSILDGAVMVQPDKCWIVQKHIETIQTSKNVLATSENELAMNIFLVIVNNRHEIILTNIKCSKSLM